mmetsp:Transcript_7310/g.14031  ORF Transcript_7310/g.14031 Transcript_7310/m.14031 type:complete len:98 (+) Transcript_7310:455-748(+)
MATREPAERLFSGGATVNEGFRMNVLGAHAESTKVCATMKLNVDGGPVGAKMEKSTANISQLRNTDTMVQEKKRFNGDAIEKMESLLKNQPAGLAMR